MKCFRTIALLGSCCPVPACLRRSLPRRRRTRRATAQPERPDPDVRVDPLQPDFTLAALPTTLRMPMHKLAFRVTHRFTRALGEGDFGDLASDLFGFDGGAQIGLELRYGLRPARRSACIARATGRSRSSCSTTS